MRLALLAVLVAAPAAAVQPLPAPPEEARHVQAFIDTAAPSCEIAPARTCVDAGWRFAAAKPKAGMTVADVRALRGRMGTWFDWRQAALEPVDRGAIAFGLLLADGIGPERLHAAFDSNGDGAVSQRELLADIRLDGRPLAKVLADPKAVDRAGLARRLGLPPVLFERLFPPPGR